MDYQQVGDAARRRYDPYARTYRQLDDTSTDRQIRSHYCRMISDLSRSFGRQIAVLDLGCGTGRYFHCLEAVEQLTAVDVSARMLDEARDPLKKDLLRIKHIEPICANIFDVDLPSASFDFIYSIGVLGEYSPFDSYLCQKLYTWLRPEGKLFFTVVDRSSRVESKTLKRRIAELLEPALLPKWKKRLRQERLWRSFYMTEEALANVMQQSRFARYTIARHSAEPGDECHLAHLDCAAEKAA